MWIFTLFLLTVLPRWAFYIFYLSSRRRAVHIIGGCAALATFAIFIYGIIEGRKDYDVRRVEVAFERLPAAFDGFRIVQFSDLHIGSLLDPAAETQAIVELINRLDADLIIFSGDLVNIRHTELDEGTMRRLGSLKARHGVISTTGNHDVGIYIKDTIALPRDYNLSEVKRKERAMGWLQADDSTLYIHRGGDSISISGIGFDPTLNDFRHNFTLPDIDISRAYTGTSDSTFNITISHLPQLWSNIRASRRGDLGSVLQQRRDLGSGVQHRHGSQAAWCAAHRGLGSREADSASQAARA